MKKNLRLLCLGLVAAAVTSSFAQEPVDMTYLLKNADMEEGLKGWAFDGDRFLKMGAKSEFSYTGYYGITGKMQEAWNGDPESPIADGYIMQRVGDGKLQKGTYVFSAYAVAAKTSNRTDICEIEENEEGEEVHVLVEKAHQYEYWNNSDSIVGVYLFANDSVVEIGTCHPEWHGEVDDAHAKRFYVATTLSEADARPGFLTVGLRYEATNANFIVWDNVSLYYFGEMSHEDALDKMAEIDLNYIIEEVADTFFVNDIVANVDTLADLETAIEEAGDAEVTAATFNAISDPLFSQIALTRKSQNDYNWMASNIKSTEELLATYEAAMEDENWENATNFPTDVFVQLLGVALEESQAVYEEHVLDRADLTKARKYLNWSRYDVMCDTVYMMKDELDEFISEAEPLRDIAGGYSTTQIETLYALSNELADSMRKYEAELELYMAYLSGEEGITFEERTFDPYTLIPFISEVRNTIQTVKDHPVAAGYTEMPFHIKSGTVSGLNGSFLDGATKGDDGNVYYTSPLLTFPKAVSVVTFTIPRGNSGEENFALSSLTFNDRDGNEIELTADDVQTDYCHNTINPSGTDGGGLPALFDNDVTTYFHSAWWNKPAGSPSMTVTLPDGGYDAFTFTMVSRNTNTRTFPAEMTISIATPERAKLEELFNSAKAKGVAPGKNPGCYEADFAFTDALTKVAIALQGNPSEETCTALYKELNTSMSLYDMSSEKGIILPDADKVYRITSAVSRTNDKGAWEGTMIVRGDTAVFWDATSADSHGFIFEPIMTEDDEIYSEPYETGKVDNDGNPVLDYMYGYKLKSASKNLYMEFDTLKTSTLLGVKFVEQTNDTVRLKSIGGGRWNLIMGKAANKGMNVLHAQENGKQVVGWSADGERSNWFIREIPTLPLTVLVANAAEKFEADCIHFAAANTVSLTANKDCAFENLHILDYYGLPIEVAEVEVVNSKTVRLYFEENIVGCGFTFTNNEGVASVEFNAYIPNIQLLEEAYAAAAALAPQEGEAVMQYPDISAYTAALEEAEAMIELGVVADEDLNAMIKKLEEAVAALKPNTIDPDKYYFIYSGVDSYEQNNGYKMAIYTEDSKVAWKHENSLEWNRIWQFVPATEAQLKAAFNNDEKKVAEHLGNAYYIMSVAEEKYLPSGNQSTQLELVSNTTDAVPYAVTPWGAGGKAAIQQLDNNKRYLHAQANGSVLVPWWDKTGDRSSWLIVEAQYDVTDIDFTEVETEKAVVKGTFDLFGRRIDTPTAPGLYIIDGKKKYIKK